MMAAGQHEGGALRAALSRKSMSDAAVACIATLKATRAALAARSADPGGEVWREVSPAVRTVIVSCALDVADAREFARRPWASYSDDERVTLGAIAREFARELRGAGELP